VSLRHIEPAHATQQKWAGSNNEKEQKNNQNQTLDGQLKIHCVPRKGLKVFFAQRVLGLHAWNLQTTEDHHYRIKLKIYYALSQDK
jgi:hypothetical protein